MLAARHGAKRRAAECVARLMQSNVNSELICFLSLRASARRWRLARSALARQAGREGRSVAKGWGAGQNLLPVFAFLSIENAASKSLALYSVHNTLVYWGILSRYHDR